MPDPATNWQGARQESFPRISLNPAMRHRIYYTLKPFLPSRLRLAMRRVRANRIRKASAQTWPIYEPGGRLPEGWPGWPEGKEFAFVLSHDVEGLAGLNRCRQLAEMEMEHGFRSSFNFIPKGDYEVPADLLVWLRQNGFEIGVHDLFHDGFLFRSLESFKRHAEAINRQLKAWGAVGFGAGFMLHQLDWLHLLNIEYDTSTFDVDPFEPQPDAAQTVFPFWVKRPDPEQDALRNGNGSHAGAGERTMAAGHGSGYIELPSTLVQDYTLFAVLQERGTDIWRRKLQWLAGKGAMSMLNTHPDYMAMPGQTAGAHEYPVQLYRDFLKHVRSEYAGRFWSALPREVAAYCRTFRPPQARPPRQVAMLSYSYYKSDNRVRRYAEALARRGDRVQAFCIGNAEQLRHQRYEMLNGVEIVRLVERPDRAAPGWKQAWRLGCFFWQALVHLSPSRFGGGCDLLHVHNVPDFLVFAGARLKRSGTRIILDIHDILPELFESKFRSGHWSVLAAVLRRMERWSCRFSDHVIIANHIWKKTILERSAPAAKVTALVNNVDLELFTLRARTRADDRLVLIYPGTLNRHQGLDLAIAAVKSLVPDIPQIELHIYGGGSAKHELQQQVEQLKLTNHVRFFPGVFLDQVPDLIANADIGIVPKRAEGFGDQAYSTKIMEFMSQGLPVVLSRTTIDRLYFDDSVVAFFESGSVEDLARAIRRVALDSDYRQELSRRGLAYARENSWATMQDIYLDVVDRLTATGIPQPQAVERFSK